MNKKYLSYIIISILCLNLLNQTINAFVLNEAKTDVIYDETYDEKESWEKHYLPAAKVLKIVPKKTTMLDLAKAAERDNGRMISDIINRTHYERKKLVVKWEKENGYIDKDLEEDFEITPSKRFRLLQEIREEEESEKRENRNFAFKIGKAPLKIASFCVTFGVAMWIKKDINEAGKHAILGMLAITTAVEVMEAYCEWSWNKLKKLFTGKNENDLTGHPVIKTKEDLLEPPKLPANYKRVDVYRYGL